MDEANKRWPNRCLPLLVANESGWVLLNPVAFQATWDGAPSPEAVSIDFGDTDPRPFPVSSHFGHGVVTFGIPYIFRTSAGWNLLARGPANWPKEGIAPLEGLVETGEFHDELEADTHRLSSRVRQRGAVLHARSAAARRARVVPDRDP